MTGLFANRTNEIGRGMNFRAARQRARAEKKRLFCEALADGETIGSAAVAAGYGRAGGASLMNEVRADLGWQAQ